MEIIKIVKNYDAYPIRWVLTTKDLKEITVRERGCICGVYYGTGSVFFVAEKDIICKFTVKETAMDSTLLKAIKKMKATVSKEVLDNIIVDIQIG
jgi:hypothetical protein